MSHEVIVVGGGIGGLTVAALLAARGVDVCLIEKEPRGGGCAATFPRHGYTFEAGPSLYACWQPGEIHHRVFDELKVAAPFTRICEPSYEVRLPDGVNIPVTRNKLEFESTLADAFPECAKAAIDFYRFILPIGDSLQRIARRVPDLRTASSLRIAGAALPEIRNAISAVRGKSKTAAEYLANTSERFRRFIDVQLQIFAQRPSDDCAFLFAAVALSLPCRGMFSIEGGAAGLSTALTTAITEAGGKIRFDSTVLRVAFDQSGRAIGVDLLSGERLAATKSVISNLTIWDTYARLIGSDRTPAATRIKVKNAKGWGAYLLYLGMDESAAKRLKSDHILALTDFQFGKSFDPENSQFMFACAPDWDQRAPEGKRAVTVSTFTDTEGWFSYHESEEELEQQDQSMLEKQWALLHRAIPELGDGIEVIETATPRSFFDYTRRKLGMVGGVGQSLDVFGLNSFSHRTNIPNLFMVGDTVFPGQGIAGVTQSALIAANELTGIRR